jgi:hypothetical protein
MRKLLFLAIAAVSAACRSDPAPPSTVDLTRELCGHYDRHANGGAGMAWISTVTSKDGTHSLMGAGQKDTLTFLEGRKEGAGYRVVKTVVTRRADAFIDVWYDQIIAHCEGTAAFAPGTATIGLTGPDACKAWNGKYVSDQPVPKPAVADSWVVKADAQSCEKYRRCVCALRYVEQFGKRCAEAEQLAVTAKDDPEACALGVVVSVKLVEVLGKPVPAECR